MHSLVRLWIYPQGHPQTHIFQLLVHLQLLLKWNIRCPFSCDSVHRGARSSSASSSPSSAYSSFVHIPTLMIASANANIGATQVQPLVHP